MACHQDSIAVCAALGGLESERVAFDHHCAECP
jgi:hypothetical protein